MLRRLNEIREEVGCPASRRICEKWVSRLHVAILASLPMCLLVPSANARRQSSPAQPAAKPTHRAATRRKSSAATTKTTGSGSHHSQRRSSRKSKTKHVRGQRKIDSERATSIQEALIREHYLSGEPTGVWDAQSEAAMRRYQGDHGWQTKEVPDSRALIKLGLGPNNDHLLNPDSAMTSTPIAPPTQDPAAPAHASAAPEPSGNSRDPQPAAKPASLPQTTPAPEPAPAPPPKQPDSASPQ